jgi:hypothetical protein
MRKKEEIRGKPGAENAECRLLKKKGRKAHPILPCKTPALLKPLLTG